MSGWKIGGGVEGSCRGDKAIWKNGDMLRLKKTPETQKSRSSDEAII